MSTSAPTPVTMSAMIQPSVSMRIESARPSEGIHSYVSNGMRPASTSGVWRTATTNATIGSTAAT